MFNVRALLGPVALIAFVAFVTLTPTAASALDLTIRVQFGQVPAGELATVPLEGWGVALSTDAGASVDSGTSDASGSVDFVVGAEGIYRVALTLPEPYPYDEGSFWPSDLAFVFVVQSSDPQQPLAQYTGVITLDCGCNDGDSCTVDACNAGTCSAALMARPQVAELCDGADNDCDGATDEGLPLPCEGAGPEVVGCADGTREGFMDYVSYGGIAACGGAWDTPSATPAGPDGDPLGTPQCGRLAGNHGFNSPGAGCGLADLCAVGWHVCYGPADVAQRVGDAGCADAVDADYPNFGVGDFGVSALGPIAPLPGAAFFATLASLDEGSCMDSVNGLFGGSSGVYGCGNLGADGALGACGGLDRAAGALCGGLRDVSAQTSDDPATDWGYDTSSAWAWFCGGDAPGLGALTKAMTDRQGGALCCKDSAPSLVEVCDGVDNDADGLIDEISWGDQGVLAAGAECLLGGAGGGCGTLACDLGGGWVCGDPGACGDLTCDGVDDDGNGQTDDGFLPMASTCGVGVCAADGVVTCASGGEVDSCAPLPPEEATDRTCDGRDGDCDGATDEDWQPVATTCGVGECARSGATTCAEGSAGDTCVAGTPASAADVTCDNRDEDCDGATDEEWDGGATQCGQGACAVTAARRCVSGVPTDMCVPGAPDQAQDTSCNGIDSDCDGETDEDFQAVDTHCGLGVCAREGQRVCDGGDLADTCVPGAPLSNDDATCDALDDDCDGQTDEDWASATVTCGQGACAATGATTCMGGVAGDDCVAGAPTSMTDATCDGVDDNCDGATDEGVLPVDSACGVGACARVGELRCDDGEPTDSCVPGQRLGAVDDTCDGIDDDCDGQTDEDWVGASTLCGEGICARTGEIACVQGSVVDSCVAAEPQSTDDGTCNGVDNDCDGQTDEDWAAAATDCGVGACAGGVGATTCVGGEAGDTCDPLSGASDERCDGVDNDCDGAIDEGYDGLGAACDGVDAGACADGVGVCAPSGMGVICDEEDTGEDVETCDEVDNDCDGEIDEGLDCDTSRQGTGDPVDLRVEGGGGSCQGGPASPLDGLWPLVALLGLLLGSRRRRRGAR